MTDDTESRDTSPEAADPAVDTRRWPVVVVVVDESVTGHRVDEVIAALDAVLRRRQRVGFVFDYGRGAVDAQQRISQWLAERVDALRVLVPAAVTVVDEDRLEHVRSMIGSGMFTMPFESWATATVDDGVAWVTARLPR